MGDPIEIDKIRVGDIVRVVNPMKEWTFTVREITPGEDGFRFIMGDPIPPATRLIPGIFGGRPGQGPEAYNQFFLVERPLRKAAHALAELAVTKRQIPHDILRREIAPMLGLSKKGGRRGRKTRRRQSMRRR